jgi:hypothetical protein
MTEQGPDEPLCRSDAAYVLGSLAPVERRAYEAHLAGCERCQRSVRELAGVPGLLARVTPADFADPPPVPATLLPGLVARARRGRTRRRVLVGLGVAAAAAVVVFAAQTLPTTGATTHPQAMHAVVASPVRATVALDDRSWGTQIEVRCSYREDAGWTPAPTYRLVATDVNGATRRVATWLVVPGKVSTITGSVDWSTSDIDSLRLETSSGKALLVLHPDGG